MLHTFSRTVDRNRHWELQDSRVSEANCRYHSRVFIYSTLNPMNIWKSVCGGIETGRG